VAGSRGGPGSLDGLGADAEFNLPYSLAVDRGGNVVVADSFSHSIRKVTPAGAVTTIAGFSNRAGSSDGPAASAEFNNPTGIAIDGAGNIFVADAGNHLVRKIADTGQVTTIAGVAGSAGNTDGPAATARFNQPTGIAVTSDGTLYIADRYNFVVRKISPAGSVSTIKGFDEPTGVAIDTGGDILVADRGKGLFKISPAGLVTPYEFFDSTIRLRRITGVAVSATGTIFLAESFGQTIRSVSSSGVITTLAGTLLQTGSTDGVGPAARFLEPTGVAVSSTGVVYVADRSNSTIRAIDTSGTTTTLAGLAAFTGSDDGASSVARFNGPIAITGEANGDLYVAELGNDTIRKITSSGSVSTLAGTAGVRGTTDGLGSAATFGVLTDLTIDRLGNLLTTEFNGTIRKISPAGVVTTLAGSASESGSVDGPALSARFYYPLGITTDSSNNIYIGEAGNETIRKITPDGIVSTLAGTPGMNGTADGLGSAARFNHPAGVVCDRDGNLYVADQGNHTIRRITPSGAVTTIAGSAGQVGDADGSGSAARFNAPARVALDSHGNLFVTDSGNDTIRKIKPNGDVSTIGGRPGIAGRRNARGNAARFNGLRGLYIDPSDHIYVTDEVSGSVRRGEQMSQLVNIATRGYCSTADRVMIGGFVVNGTVAKRVLVRAVGPSLTSRGISAADALLDPVIEVHRGAPILASNDNWGDNANASEIIATAAAIGAGPLDPGDTKSSALLLTLDPGVYSFIASGKASSSGVVLLEVFDADAAGSDTSFVNIATRAYSTTGNGVAIGGFVIAGPGMKQVMLRAVGPTLTTLGISQADVLMDPMIELHRGIPVVEANDNWNASANAAEITATAARIGASPFAAGDTMSSALLITLPPGAYSYIASGKSNTSGIVLVEVYDAD
jgi:sugar lactone lactonase YvrE